MKPETHDIERPPIVAVLGHVDHGKSTLLDFIRKSNTVAKESGGITQHVAAYEVERAHEGVLKRITFIDTPGHAAFEAIRKRGASVADIAVLVVASDEGPKEQTLEALRSIQEAGIPLIVAFNKIDKPGADLSRAQTALLERGVYLEKFGGEVPWAAISAKTGQGVDELLELVLLVAEMEGLRGSPSAPARGYVIEAHRDRKRGIAATLIITDGTLSRSGAVLAGRSIASVRLMEDHAGNPLKEASFSTPVTLVGFDELPEAGLEFRGYASKREAEHARPAEDAPRSRQKATETGENRFLFPLIVRADTTGSLEAIAHEVGRIGDEHRGVAIVQSGIGNISENDIKAAIASGAGAVLGFSVGIDRQAEALARQHEIRTETFFIIYRLVERLEELMRGSAPKKSVEAIVGRAKVLKVFLRRKTETLIGGEVSEGYLEKKARVRVLRRKEVVGTGTILSLQTNRKSAERAERGAAFGSRIEADFPLAEGDTFECVIEKEI